MFEDIFTSIVAGAPVALVVATVALVIVTYLYVRETKRYVKATIALAEAQTNPFVYLDMEWEDITAYLSPLRIFIKNAGKSPATDIHFIDVKDDFALSTQEERNRQSFTPGPQTFKKVWYYENGVSGLAPNREITLARVTRNAAELIPNSVEVIFEYKNAHGKVIPAINPLPFPAYMPMR
jgi:hypothetical protein